jgi:hypothetical protein
MEKEVLPMTLERLCRQCEALNREFNAAAREYSGEELSKCRKRLMMRYNAGFVNGWTVRICRTVSDTFTVEQAQGWEHTQKGLLGSKTMSKVRLTLQNAAMPEIPIACMTAMRRCPSNGETVHVSGELELVLFLHPEQMQWKSAAFLKVGRVKG